jgi:hypothetical protein
MHNSDEKKQHQRKFYNCRNEMEKNAQSFHNEQLSDDTLCYFFSVPFSLEAETAGEDLKCPNLGTKSTSNSK